MQKAKGLDFDRWLCLDSAIGRVGAQPLVEFWLHSKVVLRLRLRLSRTLLTSFIMDSRSQNSKQKSFNIVLHKEPEWQLQVCALMAFDDNVGTNLPVNFLCKTIWAIFSLPNFAINSSFSSLSTLHLSFLASSICKKHFALTFWLQYQLNFFK